MDEHTDTEQKRSDKQPTAHKKWTTWGLIALVLLLLIGNICLWLQLQRCKDHEHELQKQNQLLEQQLKEEQKGAEAIEADDAEAVCNDTPTIAMKDNIKAALDTKNTAVFSTYVTNPVKYVLAASEYGGDVSPDEAVTSLGYTHSATGPWDFNLAAATVAGYDGGFYTDYFDDTTYEGRAASGMVVSFDFNCDGKIKQIFVAADDDLL